MCLEIYKIVYLSVRENSDLKINFIPCIDVASANSLCNGVGVIKFSSFLWPTMPASPLPNFIFATMDKFFKKNNQVRCETGDI